MEWVLNIYQGRSYSTSIHCDITRWPVKQQNTRGKSHLHQTWHTMCSLSISLSLYTFSCFFVSWPISSLILACMWEAGELVFYAESAKQPTLVNNGQKSHRVHETRSEGRKPDCIFAHPIPPPFLAVRMVSIVVRFGNTSNITGNRKMTIKIWQLPFWLNKRRDFDTPSYPHTQIVTVYLYRRFY